MAGTGVHHTKQNKQGESNTENKYYKIFLIEKLTFLKNWKYKHDYMN